MNSAKLSRVEEDLAYISSLFETIADLAWSGYAEEGRGAIVVDLSSLPELAGGYLSLSRLLVELGTIPDKKLQQTMQTYDPVVEFVAIVRRPDHSLHGYILNYDEDGLTIDSR